ncbi:MAG: response regulator [Gammaproteobacteria bacterium]|nr:response regulator [Gammaproteobacteria bacterium]
MKFSLSRLKAKLYADSLFGRIFWRFVITSLLIILFVFTLYNIYSAKITKQQIEEEIKLSLSKTTAHIEKAYLNPVENVLAFMEMSPSVNNFLITQQTQANLIRFDIEKQFVQIIRSNPQLYNSIRFIDSTGNEKVIVDGNKRIREYTSVLTASSNNQPSKATTLFYQLKKSTPRQVHFLPTYRNNNKLYFHAGIALLEPEIGGFGGCIIIEGSLDELVKEILDQKFRGFSNAWIVAPDDPKQTNTERDKTLVNSFFPGQSKTDTPFMILNMRVPNNILQEQNNDVQLSAILVAFIAIIFIFISAWFLSKQLSSPLKELVIASQEFSKGNFTYTSNIKDQTEIGQLSDAFNTMASALNSASKNYNNELQTRINAEQDLQLILNSTSEGIFGYNLDGRCTFCNQATLKHLNYENESDLIGQDIIKILTRHETSNSENNQPNTSFIDVIKSGQSIHVASAYFLRADHTEFPVEYRAQVIKHNGEIVGAVATFMDVTEAHIAEQTLRRTQKIDALGKLTGGIAHDFNNLLGVILGYSELLSTVISSQSKEDMYLKQISNAGERAKKLTSKLLAFSRQQKSSDEATNLNSLLTDIQHMLEKTLTAQIKLTYILDENLWATWIDQSNLQDSILNMCINSLHAMPEGGSLVISTNNIRILTANPDTSNLPAGDYVSLSIADSGHGMDEDTREKVFDPFFSTKGNEGTGLGMSQVYGFIKQSGGSITLDSEPGSGTKITILFPRYFGTSDKKSTVSSAGNTEQASGKETILVVDDEEALCMLAMNILNQQGYQVFTATSAKIALAILQKEHIDLLLTDVIMPETSGIVLAQKTRELYPDIKILIASGYNDLPLADNSTDTLTKNQIQKPYSSATLLSSVRNKLDE